MNFSTIEDWTLRNEALEPLAVAARDSQAYALARRLLDRSDEELGRLRGAASGVLSGASTTSAILLVRGDLTLLPWAPQAIYLGHDSGTSTLLWPIHLAPPFSSDLIERALRRRFPNSAVPLALVPQWQLVVPVGEALPLQRGFIEQFLAQETR